MFVGDRKIVSEPDPILLHAVFHDAKCIAPRGDVQQRRVRDVSLLVDFFKNAVYYIKRMLTLDDLVERLRQAAGAEFAFALTLEGTLVTRDAPQLMPEGGRKFIAAEAEVLIGKRDVGFLCLPRGDLVPYGGPGPVEIGFGVAASDRIICVVMTTSAQRNSVRKVMVEQLPVIEAFLAPPDAPDAAPHIEVHTHVAFGNETLAAIKLDALRQDAPVITVDNAPKLGRETLAAIELDTIKRDVPVITVGPAAKLGRETLAAIKRDMLVEGPVLEKSPPIPQDLRRKTLPWIDLALLVPRPKPPEPGNGGTKEP
jgi:hypothetical protein